MKTQVITLQGHEFVISNAAAIPLQQHLKRVKKFTLLHRSAYRENIEALRDILIEQRNRRPISKAAMTNALRLVGVPEKHSLPFFPGGRFPKLHPRIRSIAKKVKTIIVRIAGHWRGIAVSLLAIVALFASVNYSFGAYSLLQSVNDTTQGKWQSIDTTIGRVRSYSEPFTPNSADNWLLSWQSYGLLALLFGILAVCLLRLLYQKCRLLFASIALISVFGIVALIGAQQQVIHFTADHPSSAYYDASPLVPRLAYLQQCGDEIPYVFEGQTSGMLFRQLRDDGFTLSSELPTNYGHPDLKQLCVTYDKLRQTYANDAIVLQLYTHQKDGTIRPYLFSDALDNTAAYGFFVQEANVPKS